MNSQPDEHTVRRRRPWRIALGISAGAVAAAAFLGLSEAANAHADTGGDILDQAGADLTQATQVLDGAPTASLDAQELSLLTGQESIQTDQAAAVLSAQESVFNDLPAADQADLSAADSQLADAFQGILTADQTFAAADQAGDLTGLTGLTDEFGIVEADIAVLPADLNAAVADIGAEFANVFSGMDFTSLF
jgi:hypothetical protein